MIRWFLLAAGVLIIASIVWIASEVHHGRQEYQAACRERLAKELRWSPRARALPLPADPCDAIRVVRRGR